jgi:hypothetical protein
LPAAVCDRKRPIEVTRAAGGSAIDLDAQIERVLPMHAVEEVTHTSTVYRRELGQHDRATAGPTDTFGGLGAARVAVLLVPLGASDTSRVGTARDRHQLAMTPDGLARSG